VSDRPSGLPPELERSVLAAVTALVTGELSALDAFADDVTGRSPLVDVASREDLEAQLVDRQGGFTAVDLVLHDLTTCDTEVVVSWRFSGDHTGEMLLNEDTLVEPTGRRVTLEVVTRFTLRDGRITSFLSEYDGDRLWADLGVDRSGDQ
jgi:hypothetical protein